VIVCYEVGIDDTGVGCSHPSSGPRVRVRGSDAFSTSMGVPCSSIASSASSVVAASFISTSPSLSESGVDADAPATDVLAESVGGGRPCFDFLFKRCKSLAMYSFANFLIFAFFSSESSSSLPSWYDLERFSLSAMICVSYKNVIRSVRGRGYSNGGRGHIHPWHAS
jgi:hypothetical protein